jgi:CheY-like chemotaxis protein
MTIQILLIEDSAGDARLTEEAFRNANPDVRIQVACDGTTALAILAQDGTDASHSRPTLILLDLNLPGMDGREVLSRIKGDDRYRSIPTLILTTSAAETDIVNSYRLHANAYLTKPAHWDDFERLVRSINEFWLNKARLPPRQGEQ